MKTETLAEANKLQEQISSLKSHYEEIKQSVDEERLPYLKIAAPRKSNRSVLDLYWEYVAIKPEFVMTIYLAAVLSRIEALQKELDAI